MTVSDPSLGDGPDLVAHLGGRGHPAATIVENLRR
jgi:hypothetical protein